SAGHNVREAVAIHVTATHSDAAVETGTVSVEALQQRRIGYLANGLNVAELGRIDHLDMRPSIGPGAGNDVGQAIAVDVGRGDVHAAEEVGRIGEKAGDFDPGQAVEDFHMRPAARPGRGDDVVDAVAVHITGRDANAARKALVVGVEA